MPIPSLIHPVPCVIRRVNPGVTKFDPRAREPVRRLWRSGDAPDTGNEISLNCQVNWNQGHIAKPLLAPGAGPELNYQGYLLIRLVDLIASGVATENGDGTVDFGLARGDRIVRIGRRRTNLFAVWFRDVAFYPDQLGGTLLEIDFSDRAPAET